MVNMVKSDIVFLSPGSCYHTALTRNVSKGNIQRNRNVKKLTEVQLQTGKGVKIPTYSVGVFKTMFSIDTYCIGTHDSMFQAEKENNISLASSCHLNTVLLILYSVPQKLPVSSCWECWLQVLPLSNAFTILSQHRMSNVFPELLSINVFALLSYTVELKDFTVLPLPRKWPCSTSNHCQCKWFLSKLSHFKHFTAGKWTKSK